MQDLRSHYTTQKPPLTRSRIPPDTTPLPYGAVVPTVRAYKVYHRHDREQKPTYVTRSGKLHVRVSTIVVPLNKGTGVLTQCGHTWGLCYQFCQGQKNSHNTRLPECIPKAPSCVQGQPRRRRNTSLARNHGTIKWALLWQLWWIHNRIMLFWRLAIHATTWFISVEKSPATLGQIYSMLNQVMCILLPNVLLTLKCVKVYKLQTQQPVLSLPAAGLIPRFQSPFLYPDLHALQGKDCSEWTLLSYYDKYTDLKFHSSCKSTAPFPRQTS